MKQRLCSITLQGALPFETNYLKCEAGNTYYIRELLVIVYTVYSRVYGIEKSFL